MSQERFVAQFAEADLREALGGDGCPLCALAARAVSRYLAAVSRESITDVDIRASLRDAIGYCPRHAWQWLDEGHNPLGAALVYKDLVANARRALGADGAPGAASLLGRMIGRATPSSRDEALAPRRGCPACEIQSLADSRVLDALLQFLPGPAVRDAYAQSSGVCLPHLRAALARAGSRHQAAAEALTAHCQTALGRLEASLDEFIRKQDYRYQHESIGEERDAPERATARLCGPRGAR